MDTLARVPGVGSILIFGRQDYGMRIWVQPDKLARYGVTAADLANAIRDQNLQAPAGRIGQPPIPRGQEYQYTVQVKGRLTEASEFGNVVLKANPDGSLLRIKDVARGELGAQSYDAFSRVNGAASINFAVFQLPGANALATARQVKTAMADVSKRFPPGIQYLIPYDTTRFVNASIDEVLLTLFEAFILVMVVVYVFLQSWRAVLIPAITVPVSLIGALAVFVPLGFSINTLTLFGLVLAVGIVVDDAIVVVEAVELQMNEYGLSPKDAAKKAMTLVTSPIIAITLVLSAVFVPVAFLGGITGELYRQFALTLSASTLISALNALTLSPALCALLLKPRKMTERGWIRRFFVLFDRGFQRTDDLVLLHPRRPSSGHRFRRGRRRKKSPRNFRLWRDAGGLHAGHSVHATSFRADGSPKHEMEEEDVSRAIALVFFALAALCSCTVGPNYVRPTLDSPVEWRLSADQSSSVAEVGWWELFQDPKLRELIEAALGENKDLMLAAARVEELQARFGATRADQFPEIEANASAGRRQFSQKSTFPLASAPTSEFHVDLSVSWELDFFGKFRRASEAARAELLSQEEARKSVIMSLVSSVASAYFELRHLDNSLGFAREAVETRRDSLRIARALRKHEVGSDLDLRQAQGALESAIAQVASFESQVALKENEISNRHSSDTRRWFSRRSVK